MMRSTIPMRALINPTAAAAVLLLIATTAACDKDKPVDGPITKPTDTPPATASVVASTSTPTPASAEPTPTPVVVATGDAGKTAATTDPPKTAKTAGSAPPPTALLKPASKHVNGKNFALDLASPGCKAGEYCAMTIKLSAAGAYHVNKEYPYKFIATPAPGVTFLGKSNPNTFARDSGDFVENGEKVGTMTVRFKPASAGDAKVSGTYKMSVCSADQCQIEQETVELAIPVL
jgi:hypothetical protein